MELPALAPLAHVEVLGRHGDVLARHPVYRWPAFAGRAYDADVILDDRFVAPRHVQIEPLEDGRFRITDLQSVNGICRPPSSNRVASAEVGPDDVVRLGQTQVRVRASSYAVAPELRLRATSFYRRPLSFGISGALLLALVMWNAWTTTIRPEQRVEIVMPALSMALGVAVWISIWSLVGRATGGRANFAAHGFVACLALVVLNLTETLTEYLTFAFHVGWLTTAGIVAGAVILAYMLYRQLRLTSRASPRRLGTAAVLTTVLVFATGAGLEMANEWQQEGAQKYDGTLKSPAFLLVPGITPEAFVADGERLKRKVDAMARTER